MDYEIAGLPLHILIVHATVVIVPLAAILTVASALSIRVRAKFGIITPLLALIALILVPITQLAGQWLYDRIDQTTQIQTHMNFGKIVLPWVAGMFLVSLMQWLFYRLRVKHDHDDYPLETNQGTTKAFQGKSKTKPRKGDRILAVMSAVLALIFGFGSMMAIYQAGESGSRAVWEGRIIK